MADDNTVAVPIKHEYDIVTARLQGRKMAAEIGFSNSEAVTIATAISELARNIVDYAGEGEIILSFIQNHDLRGIAVTARDCGPGIADISLAMQDGYSTGMGLGLGLPGTRRLMDDFAIESEIGKGTAVTVKKWGKRSK
ncbi:MAG: anti-sigma regulatory factor [bacterium]|jgi:serine/threonine-protein kinase RsbT